MKARDQLAQVLVGHLLRDAQGLAAQEALHRLLERPSGESLREAEKHFASISPWLRCEPKTKSSGLEARALADRSRLLARRKVGGAAVVVLDPVPRSLGLDRVEHGLELADVDHVGPQGSRPSAPKRASSAL